MKIFNTDLKTILALLVFVPALAYSQETIKLGWLPVPEAKKYRVEVALQNSKDKPLVSQAVDTPAVEATLYPGVYAYRVRTIFDGAEGPWSDYLEFPLHGSAIKFTEPKGTVELSTPTLVRFSWNVASAYGKYKFQVLGPDGMKETEVSGQVSTEWTPTQPGSYSVKVGFNNDSEMVFSESVTVVLKTKKAEAPPVKMAQTPVQPSQPSQRPSQQAAKSAANSSSASAPSDSKSSMPSTFDFRASITTLYTSYTGRFIDESNSSNSTTLSEAYGFGATVKNADDTGLFFAADLLLQRQRLPRSSLFLPNLSAAAGYGLGSADFQASVFGGAGVKTSGLFIIDGLNNYDTDSIQRTSIFAGASAGRLLSPQLTMGLVVKAGIDTGGSSGLITTSLASSPFTELGVAATYLQNRRPWLVNVMMKTEKLSWAATSGDSSLDSQVIALSLGTSL